jgi:riboflavin synthase
VFTGIIEDVGEVRSVAPLEGGLRIWIDAAAVLAGLRAGDSMATDGVCLTVVEIDGRGFLLEVIGTTLSRTTIGGLRPGQRVNLERALALGARLGGHLVQGHVDGVGAVTAVDDRGEHVLVDVRMPEEVADVTVLHGSIAINGVSLTVNALPERDVVQVALIPFTLEHTNLSDLRRGDRVNLEGDMIGRFVAHYLERRETAAV